VLHWIKRLLSNLSELVPPHVPTLS